ncbi:heme-binding domain-containing protein [Mucilaginibacter sp. HC2]|uniref:heme-binding domain-containing protein n=1 Tax=Mucilaginibacter TaxID=423349 RepID=UPI000DCE0EA7|nr:MULTISPECIES: heme-binding domain-containing protein [Mucilaginibacter]NHA05541.1 heme-binding domain-containing protein [Mucilaginibacter inviolabilis]QTE35350.1 heme-binding domain-containing protein [Mucilaginibacter gossypii]RAV59449.1 cytochrome C [Mucilaginibacter rubeus]
MKRLLKPLLGIGTLLLIALQFIPRDHNEAGNTAVNAIDRVYKIPANVSVILKRSCYDCHSDQTDYPWYARLQPVRLMMDRHVRNGKAELNFNTFGTYTARKQRSKLRAIGQSLEEGSMPLSSYTLLHRNAILSQTEKAQLMNWVKQTSDSL